MLCGCPARILVVEDGFDNRRLIAAILERADLQVTLAENGELGVEQALLAAARDAPFDLILMDMQMPVLDGYAATRKLRTAGYPGPIIALTAHATTDDRARCLAAGCSEYMTKPIRRRELVAAVMASLGEAVKP